MAQPPQRRGGLTYDQFAELLSLMTSGPYEHVRSVLRRHGRAGSTFTVAWASAMRSLPRGSNPADAAETKLYRAALKFQKGAWKRQYESEWPETREQSLGAALSGRTAA